jgi:short-subunit dehydrogenase
LWQGLVAMTSFLVRLIYPYGSEAGVTDLQFWEWPGSIAAFGLGVIGWRLGILNVASIAGYLPGPGQAVYSATKAFVRSFSQALTEETRGTGVRVTMLCPGPVETDFAAAAGYPEQPKGNPLMRVLTASQVAAAGWAGLRAGQAAVVPDLATRIGLQTLRFLPWRVVARSASGER